MAGWTHHAGTALALPIDNLDTDQLIPARFMSQPRSDGYGDFLMHDLRRNDAGQMRPEFPLNRHSEASILVAGRNFGSGSSREAAVYALVDAGFRAVIAASFGDIFAGNAINNGLLPARLAPNEIGEMQAALAEGTAEAGIDLEAATIRLNGISARFEISDSDRAKLINGWDDIDLTLQLSGEIETYRNKRLQTARWAWPATAE